MFGLDPLPDALVRGVVLTVVGLIWVTFVVRLVGLRSFSKMTAFDFVVTLGAGSLLASAASASGWPGFAQSVIAIFALLGAQYLLARARKESKSVEQALENEPVLLMRDGSFLSEPMREHRVSRADILAKLREANALDLAQVRAVVLETTGDISVLHGSDFDAVLLEGVRGA